LKTIAFICQGKTVEEEEEEMNRPLFVVSPVNAKSDEPRIYANKEGLEKVRDAIDKLLEDEGGNEEKFPVYQNGNWNWLTIKRSDHKDFDGGGTPCECGCQKDFAEEEA